ncbi:hypothetical protein C0991_001547, partial [Blastosporella zonata]
MESMATHPNSTPYHITTDYKGPKLSKSKGNYHEWDVEINIYLRINDSDERDKLSFDILAHENLAILRNRHQKQETSLTTTAKVIREEIKKVFACPDLSEDLLTSICILNSLTDERFAHIQSNIALCLSFSTSFLTKEDPYNYASIFSYLENEQSVRDNLGRPTSDSLALAAIATKVKRFCANCKKPYHVADFCTKEGGGMAGRPISE